MMIAQVCGVTANTPETIAVMLALASLGAIWSSRVESFKSTHEPSRCRQRVTRLRSIGRGRTIRTGELSVQS